MGLPIRTSSTGGRGVNSETLTSHEALLAHHHRLLITGLWLGERFIVDRGPRDRPSQDREEVPGLPGGVAYPEGNSTVPDLFQDAKAFLEKRELVKAEKVYQRIIDIEPKNALGYIGMGSCRFWQDDFQGAENQYQSALTLDPRSTQRMLGLAGVFSQPGKYETAVDYYQRALAVEENLADAHFGLAECHYQLNQSEEALHHYQRFLELAPESSWAESARARVTELRKTVGRKR